MMIDVPQIQKKPHPSQYKIMREDPDLFPKSRISNLPEGITFVGKDQFLVHKRGVPVKQDCMRIGEFLINVGAVSIESIKAMRTYWPREQY
jgi:hypothetical protein